MSANIDQSQTTRSSPLDAADSGPKHLGAGVQDALGSVLGGFAAGAATIVAAPALGAREGGAAGFAKGLGFGVLGAVALPVAGVASGFYGGRRFERRHGMTW